MARTHSLRVSVIPGQFPYKQRKLGMAARQRMMDEERKLDFVHRMEAGENVCRLVDEARRRIGTFIDMLYDTPHLHSALDYLTPEEYEQKHSKQRILETAE